MLQSLVSANKRSLYEWFDVAMWFHSNEKKAIRKYCFYIEDNLWWWWNLFFQRIWHELSCAIVYFKLTLYDSKCSSSNFYLTNRTYTVKDVLPSFAIRQANLSWNQIMKQRTKNPDPFVCVVSFVLFRPKRNFIKRKKGGKNGVFFFFSSVRIRRTEPRETH